MLRTFGNVEDIFFYVTTASCYLNYTIEFSLRAPFQRLESKRQKREKLKHRPFQDSSKALDGIRAYKVLLKKSNFYTSVTLILVTSELQSNLICNVVYF